MTRLFSRIPACLLAVSLLVGAASATTRTVPGSTSSLQDTITISAPGDTVLVAAGVYLDTIKITKPLTIIGAGVGQSIIDGMAKNDVVRIWQTTGVTLKGFTIRNSSGNRKGLILYRSTFCTLSDLNFTSNYRHLSFDVLPNSANELNEYNHAIAPSVCIEGKPLHYIFNQVNTVIENLDVGGIWLAMCTNVTVKNSSCTQGNLEVNRSSGCLFDNVISRNGCQETGINIYYSPSTTIDNCEASASLGNGLKITRSDFVTVRNSRILRNSRNRTGVLISYSSNSTFENNIIEGNHHSLFIEGSSKNYFAHSINSSNIMDGKPVYYLFDKHYETLANVDAGVIYLAYCDNMLVEGCTAIGDGIVLQNTSLSTVKNCTATQNSFHQIYLLSSHFNRFERNVISYGKGEYGAYVNLSNDNIFTECEFSNISFNRNAIWVASTSLRNTVYRNNFLTLHRGIFDAAPANNRYYNPETLEGNYWIDYTGLDNGSGTGKHAIAGDGIGDSNIPFPKIGYDEYPLMAPVVPAPDNLAPVANAGSDIAVHAGLSISLDGSASTDPDETYPLTYAWSLVARPEGSTAAISNAAEITTMLQTDLPGVYIAELTVTDALGLTSASDQVVISTGNGAPVADAGENLAITQVGTTVALSGSGSYDPDGDPLLYQWTFIQKPAGSSSDLVNASSAQASFTPDMYGDYIVSLMVSDAWAAGTPDEILVGFTNLAPHANAGNSQSGMTGSTIMFDGSSSSDPNGDAITYAWSITSRPLASVAQLIDAATATPRITPDVAGDYVVTLIVSDGMLQSEASVVTVTVISTRDAITDALQDAINAVNLLDGADFKNKNMQNTFGRKLAVVLKNVENSEFQEAFDHLSTDIIQKTDGCGTSGTPDKNDWIVKCPAQERVRPFIDEAIDLLAEIL